MKAIKKIENFSPRKGDVVLLDTCILLFNFYTAGKYNRDKVSRCNDLFTRIIKKEAKLLIFPEILEEFFNRFIKLEFEMYKESNDEYKDLEYKDFRKTEKFADVVKELKDIFNLQIKPYSTSASANISVLDTIGFLDSISEMDINDMVFCKVAKDNGATIITADTDYCLSSFTDDNEIYFL